jgi:uncharacterized protein (DUF983 family)
MLESELARLTPLLLQQHYRKTKILFTQPRARANRWPAYSLTFLYENTPIAIHARSRQRWLSSVSLDDNASLLMRKPVCPRCGYVFTFWRSLRHSNPYNTTCSQCGAKLRVRQATVFFVLAGLCGLVVAAVAIFCEETRIWDTSGSLKFFAVVIPLIIVPWSIFLWSRSQYILRTSSNQSLQPTAGGRDAQI